MSEPRRPLRVGAATFCALLSLAATARPALADAVERGDAAYLRRAEGGSDGRAAPGPIDEAIGHYREEIATEPGDLEARWKLLRALHFRGEFATEERDAKRRVFERARTLSEEGTALLAERVGGPTAQPGAHQLAAVFRLAILGGLLGHLACRGAQFLQVGDPLLLGGPDLSEHDCHLRIAVFLEELHNLWVRKTDHSIAPDMDDRTLTETSLC